MPIATSYDDVPYPRLAFPYTHPAHLATIGRLFGLEPADVENCRVLELGCAGGANLIPMAYALPGSHFTGIDLSRRQIDEAREFAAAVGLRNIELGGARYLCGVRAIGRSRTVRFHYRPRHLFVGARSGEGCHSRGLRPAACAARDRICQLQLLSGVPAAQDVRQMCQYHGRNSTNAARVRRHDENVFE